MANWKSFAGGGGGGGDYLFVYLSLFVASVEESETMIHDTFVLSIPTNKSTRLLDHVYPLMWSRQDFTTRRALDN